MTNILKVSMTDKIKALSDLGWNIRKTSGELGVHRDTVKKYRTKKPKCTEVTAGVSQSKCVVHDAYIRERTELGLTAQRIFQDLCMERGFEGGYESVKRYVRKLAQKEEISFRRMEVLLSIECQVDYGTGAWKRKCQRK